MPMYNFPNVTITGIDKGMKEIFNEVPSYIPMLLLFIFMVVLVGGITSQKKRTGYSDIPMWSTIAGMSTLMVGLPLTLMIGGGLINSLTLGIVITITIISGVWLFMNRNRNEV